MYVKRPFFRQYARYWYPPPKTAPFLSEKRVGFSIAGERVFLHTPELRQNYFYYSNQSNSISIEYNGLLMFISSTPVLFKARNLCSKKRETTIGTIHL